jgi:hypothetical protein
MCPSTIVVIDDDLAIAEESDSRDRLHRPARPYVITPPVRRTPKA